MASKNQSRDYPLPRVTVWQLAVESCRMLQWTTNSMDEVQGILIVKSGASTLCPLGIMLDIRVVGKGLALTEIWINGKSKGQVLDYGQTNREIKKFFDRLDKLHYSIGCTTTTNIATQASFNTPPPFTVNSQNQNVKFCAKCGCALVPGNRFCVSCGEQIPQET